MKCSGKMVCCAAVLSLFGWGGVVRGQTLDEAGPSDNAGLFSQDDLFDRGYVRLSGGAVFLPNSKVKSVKGVNLSGIDADGEVNFDTGGIGSVAVGLYHNPFRVEGEFNYMGAKIDSLDVKGSSFPSFSVPNISGRLRTLSLMGNLLVDFNINERTNLYFGGGIGAAFVHAKADEFVVDAGGGTISATGDTVSDDDTVFAWQIKTGVAVQVTRGVFLSLGYRLFSFTDPEIGGVKLKAPVTSSVELGVRFTF